MWNRTFWKLTGSGNDFVFFDARHEPPGELESRQLIGAVCDRRMGVGADGVVFLETHPEAAFAIRYFNRDGSLAELCGNASLCSVTLAAELGIVSEGRPFDFETSTGRLEGISTPTGPRISMPSVAEGNPTFPAALEGEEKQIGFARVGVPHLVVLCADVDRVDLDCRGRELRHHPLLAAGANVNFVARAGDEWRYRTYERGVEEETLACGSGSVAIGAMLSAWGLAGDSVRLITRAGAPLTVTGPPTAPRLEGEGRLVFRGELRSVTR